MNLDNFSVNLTDVLAFSCNKQKMRNAKRQFWALSYKIKSNCQYLFNGQKVTSSTGDIGIVPANLAYERYSEYSEMIVFHFDLHYQASDRIIIFTPKDSEAYHKLFCDAIHIWTKKEPGYKYYATSLFYQIIARMQAEGAFEEGTVDRRIYDAAEFMRTNFHDASLRISDISKRVCMCDALFRRKFQACYKMSPKGYLNQLRMDCAAKLLQSGYFSQEEIAVRCGYSDVKYFRNAFKTYTGKSISEYIRGL